MEEKEILLKLSPKFNFIYELGMPTGKKIKNTIVAIVIAVILWIVSIFGIGYLNIKDNFNKIEVTNIINITFLIITIIFLIKFIIHIIFQTLQYKNITYTFYNAQMEYKDTFWNQQTKVIRYENIKEIEIRKNVWERINKCGIIILYTNAEKGKNKGMIIYSVKDVDQVYDKIQRIIDSANKKQDSTYEIKDTIRESIQNDGNN